MIKDVILTFDYDRDPIEVDDIFNIEGDVDYIHVISLEAHVDTTELSLSFLGDTFPNLRKLRLNNSTIPTVRDIGCRFSHLKFLSLARCNIESLDGIGTISSELEELYLAFNKIKDCCDLMGLDRLRILDLEDNLIDDLKQIEVLSLCPKLKALTLNGNPAAVNDNEYRQNVEKILPQLTYLDEKRLKPKSRPPSASGNKSPRLVHSPLPRHTPKSPSTNEDELKLDVSHENSISKSNESISKSNESITTPQISISNDKNERRVVFDHSADQIIPPPIPIQKLRLSDNWGEHIMTEMLDDIVDDRPPSTRGYFDAKSFSPKKAKQKGSLASMPRIIRPMSAKGRGPY